ncbi:hypothetical protein D5R81_12680 [Parashewanella spongiae]|uniref:Uncharacterized protein n=1 Tax=Parashewanella spongiae TaxID=342950 RepID=A0A3A6TVN6_9GAMM|nr:hypothetical protein [Parashewanella spongiae]MCL1078772.1 hypothetical protein [Parashewanella spongiae]RJY12225.1 hypothetical protein D5R81_12680 [Parashewanella spongiae]
MLFTKFVNPIQATYSLTTAGVKLNVIQTDEVTQIQQTLSASSGKNSKLVVPLKLCPESQTCGGVRDFEISLFNNGKEIRRAGANKLNDPFLKKIYEQLLKFFNQ